MRDLAGNGAGTALPKLCLRRLKDDTFYRPPAGAQARTPAVISTGWKVRDLSLCAIMDRFVIRVAAPPLPRPLACRR
ncbi:hypothetical protein [Candidatus Foliamicus sp.]